MRIKSISLTTLLATGVAAVAIVAAPIAAAAPAGPGNPGPAQSACAVGPGTECITPGNAQINDSPPGVNYDPYGDFGLAIGGYGGGFGHGGGFGGGGGHGGR
jgi:hypothetical protein